MSPPKVVSKEIAIKDVVIPERARKVMGNLLSLKESMSSERGQLQPIGLNSSNELIYGRRRLEAAQELGWAHIRYECHFTLDDALNAMRAERDENTCREPLTPSEAVAQAARLEEWERKEARERHREGSKKGGSAEKKVTPERRNLDPPQPKPRGKETASRVAPAVGMGATAYKQAKVVVQAAKEDPETFVPIKEEMDRTGKIAPAYEKVKEIQGTGRGTRKKKKTTGSPQGTNGSSKRVQESTAFKESWAAIDCLRRIQIDDPKRKEAFQRVADWIKNNKESTYVH